MPSYFPAQKSVLRFAVARGKKGKAAGSGGFCFRYVGKGRGNGPSALG